MGKTRKKRLGFTLVELMLSMAIIGMIVVSFMPLFVRSAQNNRRSGDTLSATYLGKDAMELVYDLSKNITYDKLEERLIVAGGYEKLADNTYGIESSKGKYSTIEFRGDAKLVKVLAKVYEDETMAQLEVQYESLYPWKQGDINE